MILNNLWLLQDVWLQRNGIARHTSGEAGEIVRRHSGKAIAWVRSMRAAILYVALIGCAYRPGSFSHFRQDFPGQRTTVGCIDLSVERRPDLIGGGTVLEYQFANRCDRPATVDLARVAVIGRTFGGDELTLRAFDPRGEIRELAIDGRTAGSEAIAYPGDAQLAEVCVDAATIAHASPAQWLCFASTLPPRIAEVAP